MYELKFYNHGEGKCQGCSASSEQLYKAVVSSGEKSKNYILCKKCCLNLKKKVEQKNIEINSRNETNLSPENSNHSVLDSSSAKIDNVKSKMNKSDLSDARECKLYKKKRNICIFWALMTIIFCIAIPVYALVTLIITKDDIDIIFGFFSLPYLIIIYSTIKSGKEYSVIRKYARRYGNLDSIISASVNDCLFEKKEFIIGRNGFIITKKPHRVISTNDVLNLYKLEHRTNGSKDGAFLVIVDSLGCTNSLKYKLKKEDEIIKDMLVLKSVCPRAVVGYTPENTAYAKANTVGKKKEK